MRLTVGRNETKCLDHEIFDWTFESPPVSCPSHGHNCSPAPRVCCLSSLVLSISADLNKLTLTNKRPALDRRRPPRYPDRMIVTCVMCHIGRVAASFFLPAFGWCETFLPPARSEGARLDLAPRPGLCEPYVRAVSQVFFFTSDDHPTRRRRVYCSDLCWALHCETTHALCDGILVIASMDADDASMADAPPSDATKPTDSQREPSKPAGGTKARFRISKRAPQRQR